MHNLTDLQPAFSLTYASRTKSDVYAGHGTLERIGDMIHSLPGGTPRRAVIASDDSVWSVFAERVTALVATAGIEMLVVTVAAGEESKTLANVVDTLGTLARHGIERHDVLVALGGGVPGDLFGYVAASYMRGIRLIQVPTTVVAQVDSSIGGKVGVDLPEGKNLAGAFKHPERVLIDYDTLATLPYDEWVSGTAEVVKHGVIVDDDLFRWLEDYTESWRTRTVDLGPTLARAIAVKASIVQADELETGVRMHLNYGHTLGHALESVAGYRGIRHGEAVAWGMAMEARLSARLGMSDGVFVARQDRLLQGLGLLHQFPDLPANRVYERLFLDKKVRAGKLRWILPGHQPGAVSVRDDIPENLVRELIAATVDSKLLDTF